MEKKVLVIDVGGTFIKYGLIDEECQLTKTSKIKTPYESQEHFLRHYKIFIYHIEMKISRELR
ncbi:MAG: hypothetical protein ACLRHW_09160 [Coprobacillus cateniformis]|mgnify:CR=1 FL=1|jgi:predicted NBD/HSP70 family sugar kinase